MLQYFPCTIEKDGEETKENEDKPVDSKPKLTGSTVKPNDEKPGTTETTKTFPSTGKGRRHKRINISKHMPPKPKMTLLNLSKSIADQTKSNSPKGDSHPEESKGKVDDSGSSSRERKDVDDGEKKISV
jgi:hypothetical protein